MFTNLVLSGGAIKGFSFIGVIRLLEEKQYLNKIKTFVGSSAGSIVCFLAVLGFSSDSIYLICLDIYNSYVKKPLNIDCILNLNQSLGVDSGDEITRHLQNCLHSKWGMRSISFLDLCKKSGNNLVVCASNITKGCSTFFSVDNTPDVCVIKAVRASITIPFIFTPVEINGYIFVDAALYNNFPIDYVKNYILKDTLGISIKNKKYQPKGPLHLIPYMRLILDSMLDLINDKNELLDHITLIEIDESKEEMFDVDMNTLKLTGGERNLEKYYLKGYESAKARICQIEEKNGMPQEEEKITKKSRDNDRHQICDIYANSSFNLCMSSLFSGEITE